MVPDLDFMTILSYREMSVATFITRWPPKYPPAVHWEVVFLRPPYIPGLPFSKITVYFKIMLLFTHCIIGPRILKVMLGHRQNIYKLFYTFKTLRINNFSTHKFIFFNDTCADIFCDLDAREKYHYFDITCLNFYYGKYTTP